jgi:hypothetical protein
LLTALLLIPSLPNLDLRAPGLAHWEGAGFCLKAGAVSSECAAAHPAALHRTFRVPEGTAVIEFRAAAVRPAGIKPDGRLDVVLEAPGREYLPLKVLKGGKWLSAEGLAPGEHEYHWRVEAHAGKKVRIALIDADPRPGCHVTCSGFRVVTRDELGLRAFEADMRAAGVRFRRYDSRHFVALGDAGAAFTEARLEGCELMYSSFFKHFRRRGFAVTEPAQRLLVAVPRTQAGFAAVLGVDLGPAVTGVYDMRANRLVVYDYATNPSFLHARKGAEESLKAGLSDIERHGLSVKIGRELRGRRDDVNVSTVMHEVSHQLAFNGGLLNRDGDAPAWLVEGMAVYCEPSVGGSWQGIGEFSPMRAEALARAKGRFMTVRRLVESDGWLRKARSVDEVVLGYSQSWALFRMLIEERPRQLKGYMEKIHSRRTPEHRLTDFVESFGNLKRLEARYAEYVAGLARRR